MGTLLVVLLVIVVGTRAADHLRVKQQEAILRHLPEPEARAYYNVLRGRVRRVAVLRVVALLALVALFYCYKYRLASPSAAGAQLGMFVAVSEIDRQADQQPDPQTQPVRPA
jgi:hypothetical protein